MTTDHENLVRWWKEDIAKMEEAIADCKGKQERHAATAAEMDAIGATEAAEGQRYWQAWEQERETVLLRYLSDYQQGLARAIGSDTSR